jgi:hypothetical protein
MLQSFYLSYTRTKADILAGGQKAVFRWEKWLPAKE